MRKVQRWMRKHLEIVCCVISATYALYWLSNNGQSISSWFGILVVASAAIMYFRAAKKLFCGAENSIRKWLYPTERN